MRCETEAPAGGRSVQSVVAPSGGGLLELHAGAQQVGGPAGEARSGGGRSRFGADVRGSSLRSITDVDTSSRPSAITAQPVETTRQNAAARSRATPRSPVNAPASTASATAWTSCGPVARRPRPPPRAPGHGDARPRRPAQGRPGRGGCRPAARRAATAPRAGCQRGARPTGGPARRCRARRPERRVARCARRPRCARAGPVPRRCCGRPRSAEPGRPTRHAHRPRRAAGRPAGAAARGSAAAGTPSHGDIGCGVVHRPDGRQGSAAAARGSERRPRTRPCSRAAATGARVGAPAAAAVEPWLR